MAISETNFLEILLRQTLIGMTIYDDSEVALVIDDLNYDPITEHIFITSGIDSYKMSIKKNFDFDYSTLTKIVPTKEKIHGKRTR